MRPQAIPQHKRNRPYDGLPRPSKTPVGLVRPTCKVDAIRVLLTAFCMSLLSFCVWSFPANTWAAEVIMKSGYRLEGRLGKVGGLAENPLKPDGRGGEIDNRLIVLVDDGLRRTFVCT